MSTTLLEQRKAEVTTNCTCEAYEDDGYSYVDCTGCYSESKDYLEEYILQPWRDANGLADNDEVRVYGARMNWDRRSGYAITTAGNVFDALTINGDFTLYFILSEDFKTLACTRTSHDEMGATFLFERYTEEA